MVKLRIIVQPEMPGIGMFDFFFGLGREKFFAEIGKLFYHLNRAWI